MVGLTQPLEGGIAQIPFADMPAVVLTTCAGSRLEIDFLLGILANVANIQIAGLTVKGKAPGVAQAQGPNFMPGGSGRNKWIVRRDAVILHFRRILDASRAFDIDAQDFPQQDGHGLGVVGNIAAAATIAGSCVQVTIRAEG